MVLNFPKQLISSERGAIGYQGIRSSEIAEILSQLFPLRIQQQIFLSFFFELKKMLFFSNTDFLLRAERTQMAASCL